MSALTLSWWLSLQQIPASWSWSYRGKDLVPSIWAGINFPVLVNEEIAPCQSLNNTYGSGLPL